jgi:hypothetical protein
MREFRLDVFVIVSQGLASGEGLSDRLGLDHFPLRWFCITLDCEADVLWRTSA